MYSSCVCHWIIFVNILLSMQLDLLKPQLWINHSLIQNLNGSQVQSTVIQIPYSFIALYNLASYYPSVLFSHYFLWNTLYFPKHFLCFLTILCWISRSLHLGPGMTFNSFPLPFSGFWFFFNALLKLHWELCLFISVPLEKQCLLSKVLRKGSWNSTLASCLRIWLSVFVFLISGVEII